MDTMDHNRLLLEIEKIKRQHNRDIINPMIPELTINDIAAVVELVARVRGVYLKELFAITKAVGGEMPSPDRIKHLHQLRNAYEELLAAMNALEAAIDRGYLDVRAAR